MLLFFFLFRRARPLSLSPGLKISKTNRKSFRRRRRRCFLLLSSFRSLSKEKKSLSRTIKTVAKANRERERVKQRGPPSLPVFRSQGHVCVPAAISLYLPDLSVVHVSRDYAYTRISLRSSPSVFLSCSTLSGFTLTWHRLYNIVHVHTPSLDTCCGEKERLYGPPILASLYKAR